jgi:hypothetical protein
MTDFDAQERLRRWRLVLGQAGGEGMGFAQKGEAGMSLDTRDKRMDAVLDALYDQERSVGMGSSSPKVARWLGDIRTYFPHSTVKIMQKDAMERLNLRAMLTQPEMLAEVEPDVHLVSTLLSLNSILPEQTKATARIVVRKVVEEIEKRLAQQLVQAIKGSLQKSIRNYRPKAAEIDWDRTIRANLKHYQPNLKTIIAEQLIGYGYKKRNNILYDIVLCVDQSGSMGNSVVYSSIFGAVMASIKAVSTRMVVYDTAVVDLTEELTDPVDLLFGTQLGGGNDTPRALRYCKQVITRPNQTIFFLISDLYEGALSEDMIKLAGEMVASGIQFICLLALNDQGAPIYDHQNAQRFAQLGIPCFACTPDLFPDLLAATIQKQDISLWAAKNQITVARGDK